MIGVFCTDPQFDQRVRQLALELSLPVAQPADLEQTQPYEQLLEVSESGLRLHQAGPQRPGPVQAEFLSGAVAHRRQFGGGTGQLIAKACGVTGKINPSIADLTAGLGRDAFVLASLGCAVQMVERVPVVYQLLLDGLERARRLGSPEELEIISRMTLCPGQAVDWCRANPGRVDVIYLDPMFPHSSKSAEVKKEMRAFRSLVGADPDSAELLAAALEAARCRVVVKRPRKAPPIEGRAPSHALSGKSGRFDVYALKKLG